MGITYRGVPKEVRGPQSPLHARVVELADTLDLGSSAHLSVQVRIL